MRMNNDASYASMHPPTLLRTLKPNNHQWCIIYHKKWSKGWQICVSESHTTNLSPQPCWCSTYVISIYLLIYDLKGDKDVLVEFILRIWAYLLICDLKGDKDVLVEVILRIWAHNLVGVAPMWYLSIYLSIWTHNIVAICHTISNIRCMKVTIVTIQTHELGLTSSISF